MIIITGAAGFIGSNLIKHLNSIGITDIICMETEMTAVKIQNLAGCSFRDFRTFDSDKTSLNSRDNNLVFHLGAITDTKETNWKKLVQYNLDYSKRLLQWAEASKCKFVYASSASVYGNNKNTKEIPENENPLNLYAFSKWCFDQYVRNNTFKIPVQGWRFFNVYGNNEKHKLEYNQASPWTTFTEQAKTKEHITIYANSDKCFRDFVCVEDVVNIITRVGKYSDDSFICNLGTGKSISFEDWANLLSEKYNVPVVIDDWRDTIDTPNYQLHTKSNNTQLYEILGGQEPKFLTVNKWIDRETNKN